MIRTRRRKRREGPYHTTITPHTRERNAICAWSWTKMDKMDKRRNVPKSWRDCAGPHYFPLVDTSCNCTLTLDWTWWWSLWCHTCRVKQLPVMLSLTCPTGWWTHRCCFQLILLLGSWYFLWGNSSGSVSTPVCPRPNETISHQIKQFNQPWLGWFWPETSKLYSLGLLSLFSLNVIKHCVRFHFAFSLLLFLFFSNKKLFIHISSAIDSFFIAIFFNSFSYNALWATLFPWKGLQMFVFDCFE